MNVSVSDLVCEKLLLEVLREFRTMIGLQQLHLEWQDSESGLHELPTRLRTDAREYLCMRPTRADINHGVDIEAIVMGTINNGVDFDQQPRFLGERTLGVPMPFLVPRVACNPRSLQHSFHACEANRIPVSGEQVMQHLGATSMRLAVLEDSGHHRSRELSRMMMRTGTLSGNGMSNMVELRILHPSDNRALVKARVASNLSRTPSFLDDESGGLETETWEMGIGGVGHVHTVRRGDAKVLSHYILLT